MMGESQIFISKKTNHNNANSYFTSLKNITSKWIVHLNITPKPLQLLQENIGENPHDLGFGDVFLDKTQKSTICVRKN